MPDHPPVACTLEAGSMRDRLADWQAILANAAARTTGADGAVRVELGGGVDISELARLVRAEHDCCAFLSFAITVDDRGVALEVRAPEEASEIVASLFGAAGVEAIRT